MIIHNLSPFQSSRAQVEFGIASQTDDHARRLKRAWTMSGGTSAEIKRAVFKIHAVAEEMWDSSPASQVFLIDGPVCIAAPLTLRLMRDMKAVCFPVLIDREFVGVSTL